MRTKLTSLLKATNKGCQHLFLSVLQTKLWLLNTSPHQFKNRVSFRYVHPLYTSGGFDACIFLPFSYHTRKLSVCHLLFPLLGNTPLLSFMTSVHYFIPVLPLVFCHSSFDFRRYPQCQHIQLIEVTGWGNHRSLYPRSRYPSNRVFASSAKHYVQFQVSQL